MTTTVKGIETDHLCSYLYVHCTQSLPSAVSQNL